MEQAIDRRVTRTLQKLNNALTDLLMERSLDEITVFDLCEHAGVRRATFYTHFKDKMEFVAYVIKCIHKELGEAVQESLEGETPTKHLLEFTRVGVELIVSRRAIVENVFASSDFPKVCAIIASISEETLYANLEAAREFGLSSHADLKTTAHFLNAGITYTVLDWLRKRPPPYTELFDELEKILNGFFNGIN